MFDELIIVNLAMGEEAAAIETALITEALWHQGSLASTCKNIAPDSRGLAQDITLPRDRPGGRR